MQLRVALWSTSASELCLFSVSSVSLLAGMALAALYGVGNYLGASWIDIPTMIPTHGLLNSIGFSLCGLLAWLLRR